MLDFYHNFEEFKWSQIIKLSKYIFKQNIYHDYFFKLKTNMLNGFKN